MTLNSIVSMPSSYRQQFADDEEFVCWSKVQAESGQTLNAIVARKEKERLAGAGVFFWGVGNALSLRSVSWRG